MNLEHGLWFLTLVLKGQKEEPVSWSHNTTSICHYKLKGGTQFANVSQKHLPIAQASYLKDMLRNWIWPLCADRCKKQFEVYRPLELQEKWNPLKTDWKCKKKKSDQPKSRHTFVENASIHKWQLSRIRMLTDIVNIIHAAMNTLCSADITHLLQQPLVCIW